MKQRYIELLVVADHTTLEWHAGQDVESYILTLINLVCANLNNSIVCDACKLLSDVGSHLYSI